MRLNLPALGSDAPTWPLPGAFREYQRHDGRGMVPCQSALTAVGLKYAHAPGYALRTAGWRLLRAYSPFSATDSAQAVADWEGEWVVCPAMRHVLVCQGVAQSTCPCSTNPFLSTTRVVCRVALFCQGRGTMGKENSPGNTPEKFTTPSQVSFVCLQERLGCPSDAYSDLSSPHGFSVFS
jgi:hypothetical protein